MSRDGPEMGLTILRVTSFGGQWHRSICFLVVNGGGEDGFLLKANDLWQTRNHSIFLCYYLVLLFHVLVNLNVLYLYRLICLLSSLKVSKRRLFSQIEEGWKC